jgi:energy-coupling factor transporter ATP-binding protein EcfA2
MTTTPSRTEPIITFKEVRFAYPDPIGAGPGEWILNGVNLEIQPGQITAIMGPTGSGKSTLALSMLGIVPQSTGGWIQGSIRVCNRDPVHAPVPEMARSIGLVFQDAESQFLTSSVAEEVAFGLESLGIPSHEMPAIIHKSLERVGMNGLADRSPYQLSGGQMQRVAIASILAMQPEILILVEADASLDPAGTAELKQVLRDLRRTINTTIILITNEADWVKDVADQVLILADGIIRHQGPPGAVFSQVGSLLEVGLLPPQLELLKHQLEAQTGRDFQFTNWRQAEAELKQWLTSENQ